MTAVLIPMGIALAVAILSSLLVTWWEDRHLPPPDHDSPMKRETR